MSILDKLRRFDAYSKTMDDFRIQTYGGATITIISMIIMSLLFWVELNDYLTPNISEELFVDTSRSPNIQINIDIVFHTISCDSLDAMDSSGEQHLQIEHNIYKSRLDLQGNPLQETPIKEDLTVKTKEPEEEAKNVTCGSCYGAALDPAKCCNTCDDVREAYRERRWAFPDNPENITQCKDEKYSEKLKTAFTQGCRIHGTMVVNRVSGSFHVAPGKSFTVNHVHVHDVQPFSSTAFNTSHTIDLLTFGPITDSKAYNPLKDTTHLAEEGATMFQYYIKIVPTSHVGVDNSVYHTNQISVTKHKKVVSIMSGESGMPGAFFQYELSPLMVKYTTKERSFGHFITNVCAIIGGIYSVASLVDALIYRSVRMIQAKIEIGKLH